MALVDDVSEVVVSRVAATFVKQKQQNSFNRSLCCCHMIFRLHFLVIKHITALVDEVSEAAVSRVAAAFVKHSLPSVLSGKKVQDF